MQEVLILIYSLLLRRVNSSESILAQLGNWPQQTLKHVRLEIIKQIPQFFFIPAAH